MNDYDITKEMLTRHNRGNIELNDQDAEILAMKAQRMGEDFKVESKPMSKGLFDFADMAAFGLVPNKWRPTSPGELIHGEPSADKASSAIASITGLVTGAGLATKGAKLGWNALKKIFTKKKADDIATNLYKGNLLGQGKPLALGQGNPLSLGSGKPLSLPGGGRYPMQTTPNIGSVGRGMISRRQQLEESIARMKANPLPRYQEGGNVPKIKENN